MSEQQLTRSDVTAAYNRVDWPIGFETSGDVAKVQWAARRAIAALERLSLECEIARTRRLAAIDTRDAQRNRRMLSALINARGNR